MKIFGQEDLVDTNNNYFKILNKDCFLNVYDFSIDHDLIELEELFLNKKNENFIKLNLLKLYESRRFELGNNIFDIHCNKKYFPLKFDELCFMTNFPKLNVIIWLIDIGFYDYFIKNE